ncbi:MAG: acyl-CoA dehydrogenase [Streptosporangiales bacterium]|nr:acyl-CoA dehydrogenase [Streptosporangiales bacterium]
MDFSPTEAQRDLAALTRRITSDRLDRDLWTELGRAGVLAAGLPESVGGAGFDLLEQCSVLVELGRAVASVPYLPSIVMGASAVARFGDAEQRGRWAAPAAEGRAVLTAALTEEHADDLDTPAARARRAARGWSLTGAKTTVPAGAVADLYLVPAAAEEGLTVFLVTPRDRGVAAARQAMVDGDDAALLTFDDVPVADDRVLGSPGGGAEIVAWLATRGTIGWCAVQLGVVERALELTAEHARGRVQFDRPIGSFQAVSQRLADAYIDVEAIRLTLWQAAWRAFEGLPSAAEVATAKFWAADGGHRVAHTAVHVHGGMGIDLDHPVHRYFLAAKRAEFELGGATAQLRRIGAELAHG